MILLISHMETIGKSLGTVPNDSPTILNDSHGTHGGLSLLILSLIPGSPKVLHPRQEPFPLEMAIPPH